MAERFKINVGAVSPRYVVTLLNGDGTSPNLTGATVTFKLRSIDSLAPTVSAAAVLVNAPLGQVGYDWQAGDTDIPGLFLAQWDVAFLSGDLATYPSENADLVEIVTGPNLGYELVEAYTPWSTVQAVRLACHTISAISGAPNYVSDSTVATAINVATDLVYVLSGRQFTGERLQAVRPCAQNNCFGVRAYTPGTFSTIGLADPSSYPINTCGCSAIPSIDLGYWPLTNIVQVRIDGAVVDPATYRIDQNRYLTRLAAAPDFANPGWPTCQYLDRSANDVGTFEVMFESGVGPPPAGVHAVNHLTCELLKLSLGLPCNLPGRVTSVNRQQLSFTMINASMLGDGLTGLYDVDLFVVAYNPHRQRGSGMVWSPDITRGSYRAGE